MTRLATMGCASCATMSIGGFEQKGDFDHYEEDKNYVKTGKYDSDIDVSVYDFYEDILFPTEQELGETSEYPFGFLMDTINESGMRDKFIIAVLNEYLYKEGYWPKRLKEYGFSLVDKTKNNIGSINYIFVRNEARVDMDDEPEVSNNVFG